MSLSGWAGWMHGCRIEGRHLWIGKSVHVDVITYTDYEGGVFSDDDRVW